MLHLERQILQDSQLGRQTDKQAGTPMFWKKHGKKYRKTEFVQDSVCFVNVQSSFHENVDFSVGARMDNATYIIFIMWNSISGLDAWYHFQFNISYGMAFTGTGHQQKNQMQFLQ